MNIVKFLFHYCSSTWHKSINLNCRLLENWGEAFILFVNYIVFCKRDFIRSDTTLIETKSSLHIQNKTIFILLTRYLKGALTERGRNKQTTTARSNIKWMNKYHDKMIGSSVHHWYFTSCKSRDTTFPYLGLCLLDMFNAIKASPAYPRTSILVIIIFIYNIYIITSPVCERVIIIL